MKIYKSEIYFIWGDWLEIELLLGNGPRIRRCKAIGIDKEEEIYLQILIKTHKCLSWGTEYRIKQSKNNSTFSSYDKALVFTTAFCNI